MNHALHELRKLAEKERFTSLAITRPATGVGRLRWEDVAPLNQATMAPLKSPVFIYTAIHKGMQAGK